MRIRNTHKTRLARETNMNAVQSAQSQFTSIWILASGPDCIIGTREMTEEIKTQLHALLVMYCRLPTFFYSLVLGSSINEMQALPLYVSVSTSYM